LPVPSPGFGAVPSHLSPCLLREQPLVFLPPLQQKFSYLPLPCSVHSHTRLDYSQAPEGAGAVEAPVQGASSQWKSECSHCSATTLTTVLGTFGQFCMVALGLGPGCRTSKCGSPDPQRLRLTETRQKSQTKPFSLKWTDFYNFLFHVPPSPN
jgi:hypothetical protein